MRKIQIVLLLVLIVVLGISVLPAQPMYVLIPVGLLGLGWLVVGTLYVLDKLPGGGKDENNG